MTCLSELQCQYYVENEMADDERIEVQHHLQQCPGCRERINRLQIEYEAIRQGLAIPTNVPDLESTITNLLHTEKRGAGKKATISLHKWRIGAAAALVAAVCLALLIWLQPRALRPLEGETEILVCSARVEGNQADSYIYHSEDPDTQYIWFEKKEVLKNE